MGGAAQLPRFPHLVIDADIESPLYRRWHAGRFERDRLDRRLEERDYPAMRASLDETW